MLTEFDACKPVGAYPRIPVHRGLLPPVVGIQSRNEHSPFYLRVYPLRQQGRETVYLLLQCMSCPCHKSCRLGVKEIDILVFGSHHLSAIMSRYSPPCLFQCAHDSIDNIGHKPSLALHLLGKHEGSQLSAFSECPLFIAGAIAVCLELGKKCCTWRLPPATYIPLPVAHVAIENPLLYTVVISLQCHCRHQRQDNQ